MSRKRIIVFGCDNVAINMKICLMDFVKSLGYTVEDVGCNSAEDTTYYPIIAHALCKKIIDSDYQKIGMLFCGTGIGMAITANKCKGIRAAVCHDSYSAERAKLSNDSNVLCMGARVIGLELAKKIAEEWLSLEYKDGKSTPKLQAIFEVENASFK